MQYSRRRATFENLVQLPAEATTWQVCAALRCHRRTITTWFYRWRQRGKMFHSMVAFKNGSYLVKRDALLIYLISVGRVRVPKTARGYPSKMEAKALILDMIEKKPAPSGISPGSTLEKPPEGEKMPPRALRTPPGTPGPEKPPSAPSGRVYLHRPPPSAI